MKKILGSIKNIFRIFIKGFYFLCSILAKGFFFYPKKFFMFLKKIFKNSSRLNILRKDSYNQNFVYYLFYTL